jgi:Glycosyltransferase family 9 (heptosyltransferase)
VDTQQARHVQRIWNGTDLRGQRVLIRCYHGLGDTIQFIRYAPLLRERARGVVVWAQPQLLPVLATARGVDRLLPLHDGTPEVDYDVDVEIMELPYVFRTTLATIPADVPYLSACRRQLDGMRPNIGVLWRGGGWDERRAIPFDQFARLFDLQGVSWYRLQYPAAADEHHANLRPLDCCRLDHTADYIVSMDLIITVDTMLAHLAGALGAPVWTLLTRDADWRWMRSRSDSPWYPTMRLFRQPRAGDWDSVIDELRDRLTDFRSGTD